MFGLIKKLALWAFILMIIAAFFIVKNNDLDVNENEDLKTFGKEYSSWTGQVVRNVASLTVDLINMDWLPKG